MDLYQELILEHSKRPLHAGLREPFDTEVEHVNPTCGDEVRLRVRLDRDVNGRVVSDVSYEALGCSISTASASVLADEVIGLSVPEALQVHEAMHAMLTSRGSDSGDEEVIGDGVAFAGRHAVTVVRSPHRVTRIPMRRFRSARPVGLVHGIVYATGDHETLAVAAGSGRVLGAGRWQPPASAGAGGLALVPADPGRPLHRAYRLAPAASASAPDTGPR